MKCRHPDGSLARAFFHDQLDDPVECLATGPDPLHGFHASILNREDRLEVESRAEEALGAADTSAAVQELESFHRQIDPYMLA